MPVPGDSETAHLLVVHPGPTPGGKTVTRWLRRGTAVTYLLEWGELPAAEPAAVVARSTGASKAETRGSPRPPKPRSSPRTVHCPVGYGPGHFLSLFPLSHPHCLSQGPVASRGAVPALSSFPTPPPALATGVYFLSCSPDRDGVALQLRSPGRLPGASRLPGAALAAGHLCHRQATALHLLFPPCSGTFPPALRSQGSCSLLSAAFFLLLPSLSLHAHAQTQSRGLALTHEQTHCTFHEQHFPQRASLFFCLPH